jgi:hypothetical protein
MAAFRTLRNEVLNGQSLSPTQIIGFNQVYDDLLGTKAWRYAVAFDKRISPSLFSGIELSRRKVTEFVESASLPEEDHKEAHHEAYLNWSLSKSTALSGRYTYDDYDRDYTEGERNVDRPAATNTQSIMVQLKYHHPMGFFADLDATHVSQEVDFVRDGMPGTDEISDSFWISNAAFGYRLPKRSGIVELQVRNLFDQEFVYESTHPGTGTPLTSPYYPERWLLLHVQLWFL